MSIPYEQEGRTNQKRRTRGALLAAARDLVATGATPTVEEAAAAAAISRTTAYRYFPSQRALLAAAHPETERRSLLPRQPPAGVEERLRIVVAKITSITLTTERQQRAMLRLSLAEDPAERGSLPLRQGRAIGWIEEALAPLRPRWSKARVRRLACAIRSAVGIESLVWLVDVAGISRREVARLYLWSALALLRAALAE
jgi:AcrR family transcriptional regulator